jgi:hypothetical protein
MKPHSPISLALLAVMILSPAVVAGQGSQGPAQPNSDWSVINSVPSGDQLSVKLKNGQTVEGKLSAFTNDALSLLVKGKPVDVKRKEVLTVHHVKGKSATTPTLIGLAAGAGAGAAIGLAGSGSNDSFDKIDHAVTAGLAVAGAGAGAAHRLSYRAEESETCFDLSGKPPLVRILPRGTNG